MVQLISILQQSCLGFVVCFGPLACLSHFNEGTFSSTDKCSITLPSLSQSNVSPKVDFDNTIIMSKCSSNCTIFLMRSSERCD